ncbi:MAG: aspartate/glutamate racemase family protein, partial [Bdellovibrionales bacterium]|nr:aspartate/glutamate racemase family protein [Bdellovibrionales bacterium]
LNELLAKKIDSLILGCTHYPLLQPAIRKVIGPDIQIVSSADSVADELIQFFKLPLSNNENLNPHIEIFMTDDNPNVGQVFAQLFSNHTIPQAQVVTL